MTQEEKIIHRARTAALAYIIVIVHTKDKKKKEKKEKEDKEHTPRINRKRIIKKKL